MKNTKRHTLLFMLLSTLSNTGVDIKKIGNTNLDVVCEGLFNKLSSANNQFSDMQIDLSELSKEDIELVLMIIEISNNFIKPVFIEIIENFDTNSQRKLNLEFEKFIDHTNNLKEWIEIYIDESTASEDLIENGAYLASHHVLSKDWDSEEDNLWNNL